MTKGQFLNSKMDQQDFNSTRMMAGEVILSSPTKNHRRGRSQLNIAKPGAMAGASHS